MLVIIATSCLLFLLFCYLLGTWDTIGVFPNTTTGVASFYAARKTKNTNPTDVAVEINGGCLAKYTASTALTRNNNAASGLSCGLLRLTTLVALAMALMF